MLSIASLKEVEKHIFHFHFHLNEVINLNLSSGILKKQKGKKPSLRG